ncbi:MAG: hypothetical protein WC979_00130 [Candidatus Pacearchaeota archaeon]|jgi:hypothetical protein|nr:hypothetical protein [Clostridia bacterium]
MANKFYKLVDNNFTITKGNQIIVPYASDLNLEEFLNTFSNRELYIVKDSIETNNIVAIVI